MIIAFHTVGAKDLNVYLVKKRPNDRVGLTNIDPC